MNEHYCNAASVRNIPLALPRKQPEVVVSSAHQVASVNEEAAAFGLKRGGPAIQTTKRCQETQSEA